MQKMKNKAKQMLEKKSTNTAEVEVKQEAGTVEEMTCSFCQEPLKDYTAAPYGRFMLAQHSSILANAFK